MRLHPLVKQVLFTKQEIKIRAIEIAKKIKLYYETQIIIEGTLLTIGLLKGCIPFFQTFTMNFDFLIDMEFMIVSSYESNLETNGNLLIKLDITIPIEGRDILIIEDIVDSGYTLSFVCNHLLKKGAKSVKVLVMLDKPTERKVSFVPDWSCFVIPKGFVIGYGLDYDEKLRNLPYIALCDVDKLKTWKW